MFHKEHHSHNNRSDERVTFGISTMKRAFFVKQNKISSIVPCETILERLNINIVTSNSESYRNPKCSTERKSLSV